MAILLQSFLPRTLLESFDKEQSPNSDNDAYFLYKGLGCTPQYASPELKANKQTDSRSDIYSLGFLMKDIIGKRYSVIASRAFNPIPKKRYADVAQIQKALSRSRNVLPAIFGVLFVILSLCIRIYVIRNWLRRWSNSRPCLNPFRLVPKTANSSAVSIHIIPISNLSTTMMPLKS